MLSQIKEINNSMNIKKVAYRTYVYHTPPVRQTYPPFCFLHQSHGASEFETLGNDVTLRVIGRVPGTGD